MALANTGGAPWLARVFVDVQPDRSGGGDGVVKLYARARRTVRMTFPWPDEEGAPVIAGVEISDRTPYHRVNGLGELTLTRGT